MDSSVSFSASVLKGGTKPFLAMAFTKEAPGLPTFSWIVELSSTPVYSRALNVIINVGRRDEIILALVTSDELWDAITEQTFLLSSLPDARNIISSVCLLTLRVALGVSTDTLLDYIGSECSSILPHDTDAILVDSLSVSSNSLSTNGIPPGCFSAVTAILRAELPGSFTESRFVLFVVVSLRGRLSTPDTVSHEV